jgi:hypothetical protein
MTFRPELLDELLKSYENPEDLLGESGILKQLTRISCRTVFRGRDENAPGRAACSTRNAKI